MTDIPETVTHDWIARRLASLQNDARQEMRYCKAHAAGLGASPARPLFLFIFRSV
jgi:hypothetical protein